MSNAQPFERSGTFLYQLDGPTGERGVKNIWSARVDTNNGYSVDEALKVAMLFHAAPELLEALRDCLANVRIMDCGTAERARAAIAKATGAKQ